jgi:hypothetical protein
MKSKLISTLVCTTAVLQGTSILLPAKLEPSELKPRQDRPPLQYMEPAAPLPNYIAGAKWGTQGEPIRRMQKPLSPADSLKHIVVPPEFEVSLFASEPQIAKPIWVAWDERGRLWIAETVDYPNNMQPIGKGNDRLKICEDTNGDGKADKFTVFADKLSVPTSFVFSRGGVIVVHSGKTEFLKDTNGDDKADERRDLFTGWGTYDTHAGPSNLRYGFDGWIWGVVGYSGFDGTVGGKRARFGQGIFRFKDDGSQLEFVKSSNNNTWGLGFSEDGFVFGSTANNNVSMYMPIPNRYYEAVHGWSASRMETIADSQDYFPIAENVRQVDWHGKYTAGAGSALYTARSFPQDYWNKAQFVTEATGHLIGLFGLEAKGADFTARNLKSFLASTDEWCSPIAAEVGPDGMLWVLDWYNYIIQHNPTPHGFQNGKGNAYETPLRDKEHGRIYRVAYSKGTASKTLNLAKADSKTLVEALKSDNMLWRQHAQRLLVEKQEKAVVPQLLTLVANDSVDKTGNNPPAVHALWTLHQLGSLSEGEQGKAALVKAWKHASPAVRRAALQVTPRNSKVSEQLLQAGVLNDKDPQVRVAALLALADAETDQSTGETLAGILLKLENDSDRWLKDAWIAAGAKHASGLLAGLVQAERDTTVSPAAGQVVSAVARHFAGRGETEQLLELIGATGRAAKPIAVAVLEGLVAGWSPDRKLDLDDDAKEQAGRLMAALPDEARDELLLLSMRSGNGELFSKEKSGIVAGLEKQLNNSGNSDENRLQVARRLLAISSGSQSAEQVLKHVTLTAPPQFASGLIAAVLESGGSEAGKAVVQRWNHFTPAARREVLPSMLRRPEWANALLDGVEKGQVQRTDLAMENWAQLKRSPNQNLRDRATQLSSAANANSSRNELVQKFLPAAKAKGDVAKGKEIFTVNCANCHTFQGQGGKIGPDLTGISSRDRADILVEILDPNRSVEANYRMWNVRTKAGETFSGRLDSETQTTMELLDTAGKKHTIARKEVADVEASPLSIMPEGFEALSEQDMSALIEYLVSTPH